MSSFPKFWQEEIIMNHFHDKKLNTQFVAHVKEFAWRFLKTSFNMSTCLIHRKNDFEVPKNLDADLNIIYWIIEIFV